MKFIQIKDAFEIYDGPHATPKKTDSGPIYLGIDAISDTGAISYKSLAHLSEEDFKTWTRRVTPKEGDLVFSYEATLGKYALIPADFRCCLGRRLALIRSKNNLISTEWLFYYFRTPQWDRFIKNHIVHGSTVDRISVDEFANYPIPCYSKDSQNRMISVLKGLDSKMRINSLINDNLV